MVTEQGDNVRIQKKGVYAKLCRVEVKLCGMQGVPKGGGAWRLQGLPLRHLDEALGLQETSGASRSSGCWKPQLL